MIFYRGKNIPVIASLGHGGGHRGTDTSFPNKTGSRRIFPDILPQGANLALAGMNTHQAHHQLLRQMGERNVLVNNQWRIEQISVDEILDSAVIEEIDPQNLIVLIFHSDHYI